MAQTDTTAKKSPTGLIAAAWLVVSLPLAWGIYNTGLNAAKLFTHIHEPAKTAPAAVPAGH